MKPHQAQFEQALDVAEAPDVRQTIIIASTPRSGSHMLGHSMHETGHLGVPFEYANLSNLATWEQRFAVSGMKAVLNRVMERRTTQNGVFTIKLHYSHLVELGGIEAVLEQFPNPSFVHIYRPDVLVQAISYARARQTGVWIDGMEGNGRAAQYDHALIRACLEELVAHNTLWRSTLKTAAQPFMEVAFGDVVADTASTLRRVAAFAGVDLSQAVLPQAPPTKPQSSTDNTSQTLQRYLAQWERTALAQAERSSLARGLSRGRRRLARVLPRR